MERPIPDRLLNIHTLARLAAASRYNILKLVGDGIITPISHMDYGKKSVPVFTPEDAITVSAKLHAPKSHVMIDITTAR